MLNLTFINIIICHISLYIYWLQRVNETERERERERERARERECERVRKSEGERVRERGCLGEGEKE
jgi:hypothetical protein